MGMRINTAGNDHATGRVDDFRFRSAEVTTNGHNGAVHHENVSMIRIYRSDNAAVFNECTHVRLSLHSDAPGYETRRGASS